jgi:protein-disulfide isomerase-like protein with CxxC motif
MASTHPPFAVTWDYLCPFARNAHEHLVAGLEGGAPWNVTFSPFSLIQAHVTEGQPSVWEKPDAAKGVLALQAGVVVRDRRPDQFPATHRALFSARHDQGRDLADADVVKDVLASCGVDPDFVFKEIDQGWPIAEVRRAHEESVSRYEVFGVPTFIVGDHAVFVRLMTRPEGDAALARSTVDRVLDLVTGHPELNEFKHTTVPR